MTNYHFSVYANGVELDLFDDEVVSVSNNVTGLFDIDKLPSDFTRDIVIPGSKINNAFFQHAYDIDIDFPFLFQESEKVECYIDVSGYLLTQGYLQLNKINMLNNRVDSYDITLFGSISNFSRDLRNNFLTDLTSLSTYNHTSTYQNIVSSWNGTLFGGDIVYPLADYGGGYFYQSAAQPGQYGIDTYEGGLNVKDYKPAIRVKKVVDSIFEQFGYTYTSSFFNEPMWDDIYLVCDNDRRYPIYDGVDLDGFGVIEISPTSGSTTDVTLNTSTYTKLNFDNTEKDPSFAMGANTIYTLPRQSPLTGEIKLNFTVTGSTEGNIGYPQLEVGMLRIGGSGIPTQMNVDEINKFLRETYSQLDKIGEKTYTLEETWTLPFGVKLPVGDYEFVAKYSVTGSGDFGIIIAKDGNVESNIQITSVDESADYRTMEIPQNMPFGENGISCLDFIKSLQKKYNLIISPDRQNINNFKIETFNTWYKAGKTLDITKFVKIDNPISVIPANTLAVNELQFGDTPGKDYLAKNFNDLENRNYGTTFFLDNENRFSQGKIEIKPITAASPLRLISGTGDTGGSTAPTSYSHDITYNNVRDNICNYDFFSGTAYTSTSGAFGYGDTLYWDSLLTQPLRGYSLVRDDSNGNVYLMNTFTGVVGSTVTNC